MNGRHCKGKRQKLFIVLGGSLATWLGVLALTAQTPHPMPGWQPTAGDKMAFEVASIRLDKGPFRPPSFALSADNSFREPNGRFHADFTLRAYIEFAYKLWLTGEEEHAMLADLPKWVSGDRYAIEATAPLHATKDQYRLMMQQLLADRLGLTVHFEQREMPVLAMVLIKPGKPGPRLIPHGEGQPCEEKPRENTFPKECYSYSATSTKNGLFMAGSRGTSINLTGAFIGSIAGASGEVGRRLVDQTGLTGQWDFMVEAAPPNPHPAPDAPVPGPTMLEAVQEQLGIKLKPVRAVVPVLVIDHIQRPSEN